ncbi:MAG: hypothetical protein ACI4DX_12705 [Oliverpabstia sp.]|nr:hypothetical protein [Eubacterium sp.]
MLVNMRKKGLLSKENDVNGNGDSSDEIPMSFIFPAKNGAWQSVYDRYQEALNK